MSDTAADVCNEVIKTLLTLQNSVWCVPKYRLDSVWRQPAEPMRTACASRSSISSAVNVPTERKLSSVSHSGHCYRRAQRQVGTPLRSDSMPPTQDLKVPEHSHIIRVLEFSIRS